MASGLIHGGGYRACISSYHGEGPPMASGLPSQICNGGAHGGCSCSLAQVADSDRLSLYVIINTSMLLAMGLRSFWDEIPATSKSDIEL